MKLSAVSWFFVLFVIAVIIIVSGAYGNDRYPKQRSQKEVEVSENPISYVLGSLEGGKYIKHNDDVFLEIQILPWGANEVFDRKIPFCDNVVDMFQNKGLFVVLTYDRQIHEKGCYELLGVHAAVDSIK